MANKAKVQIADLGDCQIRKVTGSFEKDGEEIKFDKLSLVIDDVEYDFSMDSSVKKIFLKQLDFEDEE